MNFKNAIDAINAMQGKIRTVPDVVDEVVNYESHTLVELQKDQMLLGRDSEGKEFTPGYREDPFFAGKPLMAEAYFHFKQRIRATNRSRIIHPLNYSEKDDNTPDLRVTGPFQDGIFITMGKGYHNFGSTYIDTYDIEAKYNYKVFGLSPIASDYFYQNYLLPELFKHITQ